MRKHKKLKLILEGITGMLNNLQFQRRLAIFPMKEIDGNYDGIKARIWIINPIKTVGYRTYSDGVGATTTSLENQPQINCFVAHIYRPTIPCADCDNTLFPLIWSPKVLGNRVLYLRICNEVIRFALRRFLRNNRGKHAQ